MASTPISLLLPRFDRGHTQSVPTSRAFALDIIQSEIHILLDTTWRIHTFLSSSICLNITSSGKTFPARCENTTFPFYQFWFFFPSWYVFTTCRLLCIIQFTCLWYVFRIRREVDEGVLLSLSLHILVTACLVVSSNSLLNEWIMGFNTI